ncbi:MarR family transcriptional regulator [Stappia taiwanensis]|uniref:MarR family transcriptional regulator n=1 Tax=Stappia taiwanensis TaxID=992267 RepID=A0A838XP00_9HYPH|nr:MarR family transcriptional regulator [Stappia taiwanensis]MBA4611507.1 MarR family transcriptional regulator [Stappia taiwanensis]GGE99706.1 hypothetical protein GCM10007285_29180 [Stappia taiwanensis]
MTETTSAQVSEEDAALLLSHQLCFSLHSTTLALGRLYARLLAPLGLTYTQYLVMLVLWQYRSRPVKALGVALMLDSGTLTPVLKRLEATGLVTRRRDPADERRLIVTLTEAGEALRQAARPIPHQVMAACDTSGVDLQRLKGELEALRDGLTGEAGA